MPGFSEKETKKSAYTPQGGAHAILQENTFAEMIYFRRPDAGTTGASSRTILQLTDVIAEMGFHHFEHQLPRRAFRNF